MKLIITNEDPDLDGAASTYAYAEFLKKMDEQAVGAAFGDLTEETEEILEELDEELQDASYYLYSADEIIIVSASSMENISRRISEEKVTEIVDHEDINTEEFSNADIQIEDVSAASTIIAEKFRDETDPEDEEIEITDASATLLHAAISELDDEKMTDRDTEALEWLEEQKE